MPEEFKLSGELGAAGLKVPLGWFAIVSGPMALDGWVDANLGHYVGVGFLTMLLAVLVSGAAVGFLARYAHCRSEIFLIKAGVAVAVLTYGVNWAVFLSCQSELGSPGLFAYLLNPLNAFTGLTYMLTTETYTWFGWAPPAALRVIGWLAELLFWVLLGGLWASRNALNRKLYCEQCKCFAVSEEPTTFLSLTEDAEHREAVMQAQFLSRGLRVERVGPSFPASFALCLQRCKGCASSVGLHIALRTHQGAKTKLQDVSPLYLLNGAERKKLEQVSKQSEWKGSSG
jgi:hypothetical protein